MKKEFQSIFSLDRLQNSSRPYKRRKIVGRGPGSKRGKTCGRGVKGMGARSGYKTRAGKESGAIPLYRRVPIRGFSQERFAKKLDVINLDRIDALYNDNEIVSMETLKEKGYLRGFSNGVKVLGKGEITKKLSFKVDAFSKSAKEKLSQAGINV
jgi:large subunit ribosomal protein L15